MSASETYVPITQSAREPMPEARVTGPADPRERLEVTVRLRRKKALPSPMEQAALPPAERRYLTSEEYEQQYGADQADMEKVIAFAKRHGMEVVDKDAARRTVVLSGTVEAASDAFQTRLENYEYPHGTYRGRTGAVCIPQELHGIVEGVFGLDNRPFARPHFVRPAAAAAVPGTFTPLQIAQMYNFPAHLDGTGQTIGILELGGGYRPADLKKYFQGLGLKAPTVTSVSVDHARNAPDGNPDGPDGEVVLDIEVAAAVAPGAKIVVYFAPNNTDQNFLDALTTAIHDTTHRPSIISISWGGPEQAGTEQFMQSFDQALQTAAAMGITVLAAAGDNGAADETGDQWDGQAHVDFPAASPWILSCGGTSLKAAGGKIASETVWNDGAQGGAGGGGISQFFGVPAYQAGLAMPAPAGGGKAGRGVPDVAADADPQTGYMVLVDGQSFPIGGTSAVAPLYAGLIARINQGIKARAGFVNVLLYKNPGAFRDITQGNNRVNPGNVGYDAGTGWDACTGLGSPDGQAIMAALGGKPA